MRKEREGKESIHIKNESRIEKKKGMLCFKNGEQCPLAQVKEAALTKKIGQ